MQIGNAIGIPFFRGGLLLPACSRDATIAWWKDFNNIKLDEGQLITGLLDFDGNDDNISLSAIPTITGNKAIEFSIYIDSAYYGSNRHFISFGSGTSDYLLVYTLGGTATLAIGTSTTPDSGKTYDLSSFEQQVLNCKVIKSTSSIDEFYINDVLQTSLAPITNVDIGTQQYIGRYSSFSTLVNSTIWDIKIYDDPSGTNTLIHNFPGNPNGGLNSSWDDTVGVITATVNGSPTTRNLTTSSSYIQESIGTNTRDIYYGQYLDATSGQINFYRTGGTFDYIDPSDGSLVEDVSIPGDGLYTIPANGICEIITSDGSYYPVCEGAGTIIHDVYGDSKHISVSTPSWSETLYGSDFLNQKGYITKTESDILTYDWESILKDGSTATLDNDCLLPLALWNLVQASDSEGVLLYDSEGSPIYIRQNI